jgi:predicted phage-related endonuclease
MLLKGIDQHSPQWIVHRRGCVTTSRDADVVAKVATPGKEAAARKNYRNEKLEEIFTERAVDHWVTDDMKWGIEMEGLARTEYELRTGRKTQPGGFWQHDQIAKWRSSPDFLVNKTGLIEIKCPRTATHLEYLGKREIPERYQWQILGELACTGRDWCDFVSYDPRIKDEDLQYLCIRLERDDKLIRGLQLEVEYFLEEIEQICKLLRNGKSRN